MATSPRTEDTLEGGAPPTTAGLLTNNSQQSLHAVVTSQPPSSSKPGPSLSVAAAVWTPTANTNVEEAVDELTYNLENLGIEEEEVYNDDEDGNYYYNYSNTDYYDHHQEQQQQQSSDTSLSESYLPGDGSSSDAFIACLAQQFPEYSISALRQVFEDCGRSLPDTMDTLLQLEAETMGQQWAMQSQGGSNSNYYSNNNHSQDHYQSEYNFTSSTKASLRPPPPPELSLDDFPSLSSGSGGQTLNSSNAFNPIMRAPQNYAGKAKQAAARPAPIPTTTTRSTTASTPSASKRHGSSSAPVWQQAEGIQRFETGAAVAQEYSELRATARDHARLRNACFQQATSAYVAGNRALAKELGAKGRWHNDQMKAAHAGAAQQTFTNRNAALSSSNSIASSGGIRTIDLHGLHVSEALEQLESVIKSMQSRGGGRLRTVVGVGQHGKVPARLPAAVKKFLTEQRFVFKEVYDGLLDITIR